MLSRGLIRWGEYLDLALVRWWMYCLGFGGKSLGVVTVLWGFKTNVARNSRLESDETCQILSLEELDSQPSSCTIHPSRPCSSSPNLCGVCEVKGD